MTFGIEFAKQSVKVFIRTFLPRAIRVGKIHATMQFFFYFSPTREFASSVASDRFHRSFRKYRQRFYDCICHCFAVSIRYFHCYVKSRFSFRQRCKTRFCFSFAAYNCICFPMSEFFSCIYAFISLSYRFACGKPSAVS